MPMTAPIASDRFRHIEVDLLGQDLTGRHWLNWPFGSWMQALEPHELGSG